MEIYFYKDGGSAAIEFTPQVLKIYIASAKIYIASAENLKFTSQVQKIYLTSAKRECGKFFSTSDVNFKFLARAM